MTQEVVTDPVASPGGALMSGDPELEALALSTVEPGTDEQAAPLAFEQGQVEMMSGGGGPGGGGAGRRWDSAAADRPRVHLGPRRQRP